MSFASAESRWRDVYLAAIARGVSSCGDFLAATSLALALQTAGAGGMVVAGLLLAAAAPLVLLAPLTGRLADRVDSRTLLTCAGLAQAAVCGALAFVDRPGPIIALAGLLGCGLAITQPTLAALVPEMVRRDDLGKASAINQTAGTTGVLVGPALAGLLVGQFGVRPSLLIDAVSYLAIVAAGLFLTTRRGGSHTPTLAYATTAGAGHSGSTWRMRDDPLLLAMVVSLAGVIAGVGAINVFDVFFVRETLHASTTTYGVVSAAWTAGVVAGGWIFARVARRCRDDAALVQAALAMLGACCLMVLAGAAAPVAGLLVPLWLVGGVFNGGDNVFNTVVMASRVPAAVRGRAFATLNAAVQGAGMIGFLLGGLLLERFAPRPLVAAAGVAGLLFVAIFVVPVRRAARRERQARAARRPAVDAEYATPRAAA